MRYKRICFIMLLFILYIVLIPSCYAYLNSNLKIEGMSNITGNWNVKITDVVATQVCDKCTSGEPSVTDMDVSLNASLFKPGDSVTYEVTIKNTGNIDAILSDATSTLEESDEDNPVKVTISRPVESLEAGASTIVFVTIHYDENVTEMPLNNVHNFSFNINYVQKND